MQKVFFTLFQLINYVAVSVTETTVTAVTPQKTTKEHSAKHSTEPNKPTEYTEPTEPDEHAKPDEPSNPDGPNLPDFQFFEDNKYPFLVFIHLKLPSGLSGNCVGTLIKPNLVLTSAHCTSKISPKYIMVYNHNFNEKHMRYVDQVYQHKSYSAHKQDHDISILRLKTTFKDIHHIIEISGSPIDFIGINGTVRNCVILGFSLNSVFPTNSRYLGYNATIDARYGFELCPNKLHKLWKKWLCTKSDDQIEYLFNRGSPLICNGFQYGVFSHSMRGLGDFNTNPPDEENFYVFLHFYRDWITKIIKKSSGNLIILNGKLFNILIMISVYNFLQKN